MNVVTAKLKKVAAFFSNNSTDLFFAAMILPVFIPVFLMSLVAVAFMLGYLLVNAPVAGVAVYMALAYIGFKVKAEMQG